MRVARQPAYPGGDGLAAIGDGQHGNAGADGENQQQGAGLRQVLRLGGQHQDRCQHRARAGCPHGAQRQPQQKAARIPATGSAGAERQLLQRSAKARDQTVIGLRPDPHQPEQRQQRHRGGPHGFMHRGIQV
ncbi:hypothetical protein G6F65_020274 [Rhizopus arrhizus]|nr:hypothetical protein G6F65_020274 [Rhizopus arrhizus]